MSSGPPVVTPCPRSWLSGDRGERFGSKYQRNYEGCAKTHWSGIFTAWDCMLWNAAWKHNAGGTALDDSSAWESQILWHFVLSARWEWILKHSSPRPCPSTISVKANWQRPQLYQGHPAAQVPDSPGAVLASLPSSLTVPQWPKGSAPYHPSGNVQWNSSPASQYLGDSLLPRWALRPTQVHPRAPGAQPSWMRALPSAWQGFLQLQSSLEQRQTPGQPGNRNKLCE